MAVDLQPDMRCIGIAATIAEARALFLTSHPDVLLTDVRLPDGDGVDAARSLLELDPELRVVVLTAFTDVDLVARVASIGGCGILPKESSISNVLGALRRERNWSDQDLPLRNSASRLLVPALSRTTHPFAV